ncbi:MAG: hypothetical protein ACRCZ0_09155 [Cetobacterium sp.]
MGFKTSEMKLLDGTYTMKEVVELTGRTPGSIASFCARYGYSYKRIRKERMTAENIEFLKRNYGKMSCVQMSIELGFCEETIIIHARKLGVKSRVAWKEEEIQFIRDNHKTMSVGEMAAKLCRTYQATAQRKHIMGLRKNEG